MDSIVSTFHIDWKIMIAQALNFGMVFLILYLFALKPLIKIMQERTKKIEKGISDAQSNALILNNTKTEYEKALIKARNEADKIFQEGKKEAETKRSLMLEKAKEEVTFMIENGKKNLENEKIKMVKEATADITALSVRIAEKILGQKIDESFNEKTIKELDNI